MFILLMLMEVCGVVWEQKKEIIMSQQNLSDKKTILRRSDPISPDGLAQAFIIGEKFIGNDSACLVLGDNIFYGAGLNQMLHQAVVDAEQNNKATVFGYRVSDSRSEMELQSLMSKAIA